MATATYFFSMNNSKSDARIYRMDPPYEGFDRVVVSKRGGHPKETFIFGIKPDDKIDWDELPGSRKGTWTHAQILEGIGYQVITPTSHPPKSHHPTDDAP